MKALKYFTAVAAMAAMAACNNDDLGSFANGTDAVHIHATVTGLTETRSNPITSAAFEDDDKISITSEGQTAVYTYDELAPDGPVWTADGGNYLKWLKPTQKFTAYFPNGYTGSEPVQSDQSGIDWSDANYIGKSDYMSFEGDINKPATAPYTISLEMERQTTRVVIDGDFSYNNELESLDGYTISVTISDGTTVVTPCLYNENYYALLHPVAVADATTTFITITLKKTGEEDKEYIVKGIPELKKGYSYKYTVTIGKERAEIGTAEVAPWTDGDVIGDDENITEEI